MGRPPRAGPSGAIRRHCRGDVSRPDLAPFSHRAGQRAARVQLPASTQRLEVKAPDGEILAGVLIPSFVGRADDAPTLVGFGANAWNAGTMALILHSLFPDRGVVVFHYRGYAPSSGRPRAQALLSDSLVSQWRAVASWFDALRAFGKERIADCSPFSTTIERDLTDCTHHPHVVASPVRTTPPLV